MELEIQEVFDEPSTQQLNLSKEKSGNHTQRLSQTYSGPINKFPSIDQQEQPIRKIKSKELFTSEGIHKVQSKESMGSNGPNKNFKKVTSHLNMVGEPHKEENEVKIVGAGVESRIKETAADLLQHTSQKMYSDVLLIVTGGTLCMINTDHGYVAAPGLADRLRKNSCFYDEEHAYHINLDPEWLVTPPTPYNNRIRFKVLEFEKLIDSSNIEIDDQIKIAKTIATHYKNYDGFVVCHGTDTMAYTASTLSFMLENLNKTVVLTGSQIPIAELRNDAVDNLLGALLVAGPYLIPEVVLFFGNRLYRGNRATKEDSLNIQAFNSPNMEPLARFGVNFSIMWDKILPHNTG